MSLEIFRFRVILLQRQKSWKDQKGSLRAATILHKTAALSGFIAFRRRMRNVVTLSATTLEGPCHLMLLPPCDKCIVGVKLHFGCHDISHCAPSYTYKFCWMIVLLTRSRIIPDMRVQGLIHKRGVESSRAALGNIKEQSILSGR
jgi:hypothetical protein